MDVDTTALRSPAPPEVKDRWAQWSPSPATSRGMDSKIESASKRRQDLVATKALTLAQHNENVSTVAEQQKQRTLAEVTNAKSVNVAKAAKAEEKRNAAVAKIVDTARSHTAHAKDVAAEVEARRKTDAEEAREVAERKLEAAAAKVAEAKSQSSAAGAAEVAKAKALAQEKKDKLQAARETAELKLAAADSRRDELALEKMGKLEALSERAKQVRKTKGSTPARGMVVAEAKKAAVAAPVQFDLPVRSPVMPEKSPVQLRLEERKAAYSVVDVSDAAYDAAEIEQNLIDATHRKQELTDAKVSAAAAKHAKIAEAAQQAREAQAESLSALEAKATTRQANAANRRLSILAETVEKNAVHFEKAKLNSSAKKNESVVLETDHAESLKGKLADADMRRALMSAEKSKKAEAFAAAWSPKNSEIRSPGKNSPDSSSGQSLASPKATVSASATADAIMRAADEGKDAMETMEALKRSPRKSIDAFLQATPPKAAAGDGDNAEGAAEVTTAAAVESAVAVDTAPKPSATDSMMLPAAALAAIIFAILIAQMM
jgi:hypothetical protein